MVRTLFGNVVPFGDEPPMALESMKFELLGIGFANDSYLKITDVTKLD